jgi:hypothetical protein
MPMLAMCYARQELLFGCAIAAECIRDDDPRHIPQALQERPGDFFRRGRVPPARHEDIEPVAILIARHKYWRSPWMVRNTSSKQSSPQHPGASALLVTRAGAPAIIVRMTPGLIQFGKVRTLGTLNTAIDFGTLNLLSWLTGIDGGLRLAPIDAAGVLLALTNSCLCGGSHLANKLS